MIRDRLRAVEVRLRRVRWWNWIMLSVGVPGALVAILAICDRIGDSGSLACRRDQIAHYMLVESGDDDCDLSGPFSFRNVEFKSKSLYLNGMYSMNDEGDGYKAIATLSDEFDYRKFSVSLDFNAIEFNSRKSTILVGGYLYRWLSLRWDSGKLEISFNNRLYWIHYVEHADLTSGKWHNVIVSFDLGQGFVNVMLDGFLLPKHRLPEGFRLDVVGSPDEATEKNITFTDYGRGSVLHGYVRNLRVIGRPLVGSEMLEWYGKMDRLTSDR